MKTVAMILKIASCASALWLVGGAFLNKGVLNILLAVPARIIVAMLVLLAWAKLKESLDGLRDNKRGLVDGVLIPFAVAMFIFNVPPANFQRNTRCEGLPGKGLPVIDR